jgi:hypothetical protein
MWILHRSSYLPDAAWGDLLIPPTRVPTVWQCTLPRACCLCCPLPVVVCPKQSIRSRTGSFTARHCRISSILTACGVAKLVMVWRGSVGMMRRGSVGYGAAWLSWLWCGVALLAARRLAVRQARVRFSGRHHRAVFPTEHTSDEEMERSSSEW